MTIYYDNRFGQNEWFVLTLLCAYVIVFLLPRRFTPFISALFLLFGIAAGLFMDHAISVAPIDFYDVNDSSGYEIFDFLLYCGYGPFSYFIIYFFDKFKLKEQHILFYIPGASAAAVAAERLSIQLGVFHYKDGYKIIYSFPVYLAVFSILFVLYFKLCRQKNMD